MNKYSDLNELFENDSKAKQYYDELPNYVKDQINTRARNVNTFEKLQDYAENLMRGDD